MSTLKSIINYCLSESHDFSRNNRADPKYIISEMTKSYLNESSADDYHQMIHTGKLPKSKKSKISKPVKSYDELRGEISKVRNVKERVPGEFNLHNSTSSTTPNNILKKSGWEHHSGTHTPYGSNSKVVYKHPDGHTATYHHDSHILKIQKKT